MSYSETEEEEEQIDGSSKQVINLKRQYDILRKQNEQLYTRFEQYDDLKEEIYEHIDSNGNPKAGKTNKMKMASNNIDSLDLDDFEVQVPNYLYIPVNQGK